MVDRQWKPPRNSGDERAVPPELRDASRGQRLHKVIADAGLASRREAERLIAEGHVTVNGQTVTQSPAWVDPARDVIKVDGRLLKGPRELGKAVDKIYVALYKPRGVVTTTQDELGRRSVTDLIKLPGHLPQRIFPVGRLDADSSGLLLLTNDGDLANHLTHPRYEVPKQYMVAVSGRLKPEDVQSLREGLILAHRRGGTVHVKRAAMTKVELVGHGRDRNQNERTNLIVTLHEGQNREIRRLLARLGHKVRRLRRVAIGPLSIKGMSVGEWRLLTASEVNQLRHVSSMTPLPKRAPKRRPPARGGPTRPPQPRRGGPRRPK
jgi:23S rRNA pseudouridine2605 synthase